MTTNFKFNNGGTITDFDDVFIKKELFSSGGLWGCGSNADGALGDNTTVYKSSPVQTIAGGANWKQVACGGVHTAAIKTDGSLWLWGSGTSGQLGNNAITSRSSPVQTVSSGTNWKQVDSGGYHTAAIKTDGTLWLWGYASFGQLGNNAITHRSSPVQTVAGGTNWKLVSCGGYHTAAIKTDGTLWTCGFNTYGQLGDNTVADKSSPIQTIAGGTNWKQVSSGRWYTAAIKTDGTLWLWGYNAYGNLGNNVDTNSSSPVQTVAGGTNWKQVDSGAYHTAAIKTDGTLWTWGKGTIGQLGNNDITHRSSPVQTIAGGVNWKLVTCGGDHTAAIKTDGTLWSFGWNNYGQLGDNTVANKSSPIQTIAGGTNWKQVDGGLYHTAAAKDDY